MLIVAFLYARLCGRSARTRVIDARDLRGLTIFCRPIEALSRCRRALVALRTLVPLRTFVALGTPTAPATSGVGPAVTRRIFRMLARMRLVGRGGGRRF